MHPVRGGPVAQEGSSLTVTELMAKYLRLAHTYYQKHGRPTREVGPIKVFIRAVKPVFGRTSVSEFGPLALKDVREQ